MYKNQISFFTHHIGMIIGRDSPTQLCSIFSSLNNTKSFDLHYINQYYPPFHLVIVIYRTPITPFNSLKFLSSGSPSSLPPILSSFLMSHNLSIQHWTLIHRNLSSQGSCPPHHLSHSFPQSHPALSLGTVLHQKSLYQASHITIIKEVFNQMYRIIEIMV